ncbi:hypothetical protein BDY21DRAFT_370534 [Lineolata rhizophorae]|uniref:Uncharacterized protein n=1 Tax=Lineolata rhizophorae TaxID=578093 RepID=A0A6A6P4W4_9PEZI|nr:hypothetical protein BDY21DRAFT_370534 [Lineolata rhizophorae]
MSEWLSTPAGGVPEVAPPIDLLMAAVDSRLRDFQSYEPSDKSNNDNTDTPVHEYQALSMDENSEAEQDMSSGYGEAVYDDDLVEYYANSSPRKLEIKSRSNSFDSHSEQTPSDEADGIGKDQYSPDTGSIFQSEAQLVARSPSQSPVRSSTPSPIGSPIPDESPADGLDSSPVTQDNEILPQPKAPRPLPPSRDNEELLGAIIKLRVENETLKETNDIKQFAIDELVSQRDEAMRVSRELKKQIGEYEALLKSTRGMINDLKKHQSRTVASAVDMLLDKTGHAVRDNSVWMRANWNSRASSRTHLRVAEEFFSNNQLQQALVELSRLLTQSPPLPLPVQVDALLLSANILRESGSFNDAIMKYLAAALRICSANKDKDMFVERGRVCFYHALINADLGRWLEASLLFSSASNTPGMEKEANTWFELCRNQHVKFRGRRAKALSRGQPWPEATDTIAYGPLSTRTELLGLRSEAAPRKL